MAEANVNDSDQVKQAADLFCEIANSASSIERLCYTLSHADHDDVDALNVTIDTVRTLVARIGWLGDLGSKKLTGVASVNGDAEQWMVNPAYVHGLNSVEVAHV